jgi:hypothetical protein
MGTKKRRMKPLAPESPFPRPFKDVLMAFGPFLTPPLGRGNMES